MKIIKVLTMEGRISTLTLLCLVLSGVGALQVNIPQDVYEYMRGDNITLPCSFTPKTPLKEDQLCVISWSVEAAEAGGIETLILTYYSPVATTDIRPQYEGRVSLDVDVAKGKADLKLSSITLADNAVFKCRVQIPGDDEGKPADTARLVVLVAPSTPICKIQGMVEYGENINLTCVSEEGFPQPTYKWEGRGFRNKRRVPNPRTTDRGGILSLYNISRDTSGFYICTSNNKVRSATCNITLSILPPIAPSTPICKIQGKVEYGENINLTCLSERGFPQPTYKWESRDVENTPHVADPRTTDRGGILSLYNISRDTSGFYICTSNNKVRSATCNITLSILPPIAPSTPICKIQGKVEYGENINLTCLSERGFPQPTYKWESRDVENTPHVADPRTTDKGGFLSMYDISTDTSGNYICTSSNKIRSATCNITLSILPPSMNTSPTAGIICGVIATLIVLIIIVCCCCKKKKV